MGLKHENFIRAIAGCYFVFVCSLFERLRPDYTGWCSTDKVTDIGQRYLDQVNAGKLFPLEVDKFAQALKSKLPNVTPLSQSLANAGEAGIGELENGFRFVVDDNPQDMDADEALRHIQFHHDFLVQMENEGIEGSNWDSGHKERFVNLHNRMKQSWRPRYRKIPLDNWNKRARAIAGESDDLIALAAFQALRNDMAYLEEVISEAAASLDAWIQSEIDRMRGK